MQSHTGLLVAGSHAPARSSASEPVGIGALPSRAPDEPRAEAQGETAPAPARESLEAITPAIWRVLRRTGVLPGELEDAVQSVLVQLCRRWSQLHRLPPDELRAYACCAAAGVATDVARRRGRDSARLGPLEEDPADEVLGPEDLLERKRARASLDRILERMPEERRVVFVLYEIEELSAPQIAEHLGVPLGTVASRLRKARQDFEQAVSRLRAARDDERMPR